MKSISVVILNYNGAEMLRNFLPTLLRNTPAMVEVVVADNASTDDSVTVMQNLFPEVTLIKLERNWGFAEGYNRALQQVKSDYYVLLNSDVEVTEGWIEPMLSVMENDAAIAACQPKILDYKRKTHFEYAGAAGGFIDYYGYPYCRGRIFDTVEQDVGQYDEICDIFWATGAALMIRSADYWNAGGLDERFFAHMEEVDLCWRLHARSRRVVCVPQSTVYHVGGATLNYNNPRKTYLNFRNNLLMLYKNLPDGDLFKVMLFRAVFDYVAALKFLLSGDGGAFKAVMKARADYRHMKHLYADVRKKNLECTTAESPVTSRLSILWKYYVCGCKYYTQLK